LKDPDQLEPIKGVALLGCQAWNSGKSIQPEVLLIVFGKIVLEYQEQVFDRLNILLVCSEELKEYVNQKHDVDDVGQVVSPHAIDLGIGCADEESKIV